MDPEAQRSIPLQLGIKYFLFLGRILGILPYRKSPSYLIPPAVIAVFLLCNGLVEFTYDTQAPKRNVAEIAGLFANSMFNVWGGLIYLYFLLNRKAFLKIYDSFNHEIHNSLPDTTLRRDTILITTGVMMSAILENFFLGLNYVKQFAPFNGQVITEQERNMTSVEVYFKRGYSHYRLHKIFGYSIGLSVFAFFLNKTSLYAWNFVDIIICVFARAMYFRFTSLTKCTLGLLHDHRSWTLAVSDHISLTNMVNTMDEFFSPLIFGSYAMNLLFICVMVFWGMNSEPATPNLLHYIYAPWALIHLAVRVFLVSITCSRIYTNAHRFRMVLQQCPAKFYSTDVSRLDFRILSGPDIGFTGLGCFTVKKPLFLAIMSVVLNFEIIMIQSGTTTTK